jgi:hypothetical protein
MTPSPDLLVIEATYLAEIEESRLLRLRLVELQATTRLVALRRKRGVSPDGSADLAAILATFPESLVEDDLVAARRLLETSG